MAKTHHVITVEYGWAQCGVGAEICGRLMDSPSFFELDAPCFRVAGVDVPMPYALTHENACMPNPAQIAEAVKVCLGKKKLT